LLDVEDLGTVVTEPEDVHGTSVRRGFSRRQRSR
jgi:hypothetical protein